MLAAVQQLLLSVTSTFGVWQNTDAALLPTISYPAFAVDDDALYSQTLDKIVRKLRGKYGFKRFLRDGYRTSNEDKNRRYYKPAEMKVSAVKMPKNESIEVNPAQRRWDISLGVRRMLRNDFLNLKLQSYG